jgi:hypothetical protein
MVLLFGSIFILRKGGRKMLTGRFFTNVSLNGIIMFKIKYDSPASAPNLPI